jgi:tetratricopeptide (TPR) repeat protein
LRGVLTAFGDFGRILTLLRESDTLATALDDSYRLGAISASMAQYFLYYLGDYDHTIVASQRALALAAASSEVGARLSANVYLNAAYYSLGDYQRAMDCCRQNATFLTGELARERFGLPVFPAVNSWGWLAWNLTEVGVFAEAIAWGEDGVRTAETVDHPVSLASAYAAAGRVSFRQGDFPKAIPMLERGLRVCQAVYLPLFFPRLAASLGTAYMQSGRLAEGLALLEQAMEQSTAMQIMFLHALWLIHLGEGYPA